MYGGIIAVPIIIGGAAGLSPAESGQMVTASLFVGGLATLIQSIGFGFIGSKLPLIQGVSFAGVATMLAILQGGGTVNSIFGSIIVASGNRKEDGSVDATSISQVPSELQNLASGGGGARPAGSPTPTR